MKQEITHPQNGRAVFVKIWVWSLFRHYWIVVKLVINILSTLILLIHMKPIQYMACVAADGTLSSADHGAQVQLVVAAGAGLLALLAATALEVYKPRAMTAYGWRKQYAEHGDSSIDSSR